MIMASELVEVLIHMIEDMGDHPIGIYKDEQSLPLVIASSAMIAIERGPMKGKNVFVLVGEDKENEVQEKSERDGAVQDHIAYKGDDWGG